MTISNCLGSQGLPELLTHGNSPTNVNVEATVDTMVVLSAYVKLCGHSETEELLGTVQFTFWEVPTTRIARVNRPRSTSREPEND